MLCWKKARERMKCSLQVTVDEVTAIIKLCVSKAEDYRQHRAWGAWSIAPL